MSQPSAVRLFFALWPDAALQQALFDAGQTLYQVCGGRRTRRENLHLTLAFLGAVAPEQLSQVVALAEGIHAPGFALRFDRLGWWRQNQVAWAAASETPRALLALVRQLQLGLTELGFKFDERRYVPHITLLRQARCPGGIVEGAPIDWSAREFVLVRSTLQADGPHYAIIGRWPLRASSDGASSEF